MTYTVQADEVAARRSKVDPRHPVAAFGDIEDLADQLGQRVVGNLGVSDRLTSAYSRAKQRALKILSEG